MTLFSRRAVIQGIAASSVTGSCASSVDAQTDSWPSRPIRWVVGVPPAGSADPLTRAIADQLSKRLNQTIVIENKPGAAQALAMREVANSPADGYTLVTVAGPNIFATPTPTIGSGFDPVIQIANQPMIIAGSVKRPTSNLKAVLEAAKAKPDDWSFASAGVASSHHVVGELLNSLAGTRIQHVPYRGGGAAMTDAISGQIPLIIVGTGPAIPQIQAGILRGYALTTSSRLKSIPDVPTLAELGFGDIDLPQWFGVAIKSGTPQPIVERFNREIGEIIQTPQLRDLIEKLGAVPVGGSASQWGKVYADDYEKWTKLFQRLNIPLQ
jgi:tripartite-type tricarboxylate transporter receptor subunit TctC